MAFSREMGFLIFQRNAVPTYNQKEWPFSFFFFEKKNFRKMCAYFRQISIPICHSRHSTLSRGVLHFSYNKVHLLSVLSSELLLVWLWRLFAQRIHKNFSKSTYLFSTLVFPQRGACIFGNFSGSLYCFLSIFRRCKREEMHHVVFWVKGNFKAYQSYHPS